MYAKKFKETPKYLYAGKGNDFYMLLPRDMTEAMESSLVCLKQGEEVAEHSHPHEEQVYFILKGRGTLRIGREEAEIAPEMVVYIPRGAPHAVKPLTKQLVYAYVCVWPGGLPPDNKDWKKAMKVQA
jgi:quercetin dioxygenase-like cupin family protein